MRREPCAYVFNVAQREALMIHEGEGFVRDASAAGLCVLLDRKPEDHGILEVRTAGLESAPWICLVGVCWIRELPTTRKLKWVAGGRCLFGCALN